MPLSDEQRARTIARFEEHRRAWDENPALRTLYAEWYGRIAAALPPAAVGPRVEIGSGPGFARQRVGLRTDAGAEEELDHVAQPRRHAIQ